MLVPPSNGLTLRIFILSELVYSLFLLSELVCTKNVFYPILLFPTFSPQASSSLSHHGQTEGQRNFNTPRYLSSFFFPLSARGPTRRRNSTGLAELWGGWPIELGNQRFPMLPTMNASWGLAGTASWGLWWDCLLMSPNLTIVSSTSWTHLYSLHCSQSQEYEEGLRPQIQLTF